MCIITYAFLWFPQEGHGRRKSKDLSTINRARTLVLCDSRGEGLSSQLSAIGVDTHQVRVCVFKGATYHRALSLASRKIARFQPDLIIFMVGLCNLTSRNPVSKICNFRFASAVEASHHVRAEIETCMDTVHKLAPAARALFSPITGIDFDRYNGGFQPMEDHLQQAIMNESIRLTTEVIVRHHQGQGSTPPWENSTIHRKRDPRTPMRHRYERLPDGCHLSTQTKLHWAHAIARCISFNMEILHR